MHNQLEKYLSQIEKQLATLPAEKRQEELREIRSHLEMMIDENIARGFDADEAARKAIEQFGAADKLGRDLKFPPGSKRRFLQKYWFRVFRYLSLIAIILMLLSLTKSGFVPYFPSISPSLNSSCILVVTFLLGWTLAVLNPSRERISLFDGCVMFCCIIILTFRGVFWGFTSPPDFTFAAFFAGYYISRWQKSRHSVVAN